MSTQEQRERFEAWCISEGINAERSPVTGVYSYPSARVAWRAWKAAEAAAIERCAKWLSSTGNVKAANGLIRALLPKEE